MHRSRRVTFDFYTRSWRCTEIRPASDRMSALPNCVAWYCCDRDSGVPTDVPAGVRLAWLSVTEDDAPPAAAGLVFRARALRGHPVPHASPPVCPAEDGVRRPRRVACDVCGHCWRPAPESHRAPLPVIDPSEPG